jgi:hypothetical protein
MQVNVVWVDVAPHLASKEQPVIVVPRDNKLWISVSFNADDEEKFLYTAAGVLARIPINAFRDQYKCSVNVRVDLGRQGRMPVTRPWKLAHAKTTCSATEELERT